MEEKNKMLTNRKAIGKAKENQLPAEEIKIEESKIGRARSREDEKIEKENKENQEGEENCD